MGIRRRGILWIVGTSQGAAEALLEVVSLQEIPSIASCCQLLGHSGHRWGLLMKPCRVIDSDLSIVD